MVDDDVTRCAHGSLAIPGLVEKVHVYLVLPIRRQQAPAAVVFLFGLHPFLLLFSHSVGADFDLSYLRRHEDVARCVKGNSALIVPNAIVVEDKFGQVFARDFCGVVFRHMYITVVWPVFCLFVCFGAARCAFAGLAHCSPHRSPVMRTSFALCYARLCWC